jgi:hypothetical protein
MRLIRSRIPAIFPSFFLALLPTQALVGDDLPSCAAWAYPVLADGFERPLLQAPGLEGASNHELPAPPVLRPRNAKLMKFRYLDIWVHNHFSRLEVIGSDHDVYPSGKFLQVVPNQLI